MSSKRGKRRKSCKGKVRYTTRQEAINAAFLITQQAGSNLAAYHCRFGDHWHIGHTPKKIREAIEERQRNKWPP